jgi:hypothetical protein
MLSTAERGPRSAVYSVPWMNCNLLGEEAERNPKELYR